MIIMSLTQAIFKDAPDWVKSAAVDSDGTAVWHLKSKSFLLLRIFCEKPMFKRGPSDKVVGSGYDAKDWHKSAINRMNYENQN